MATPTCRSVSATAVDAAVTERLLAALNPEEVALALAAADEVAGRRARTTRAAELAVERARYDADRAERAFHAAEPENRLVTRTLETRWEAKLAALTDAETAHAAAQDTAPALPARADLEALVTDLPGLWQAASTTDRDRKRLLRTLIADVTVLPEPDRGKCRVGIRWHSGAADEIVIARPACRRRAPHPARRGRTDHPAGADDQQRRPCRRTGRRRPQHRGRPALRRQGRAVDPARLPRPQPASRPATGKSPSPRSPAGSVSARTPSTTGSPTTSSSPVATAPAAGGSRSHPKWRRPAGNVSRSPATSPPQRHTRLQEGLYEVTVPTVADRVVQASLKAVLEPIFEADFKPCSYGFRPNRRAQDAIAEIHHLASGNIRYHWILEADIKACFDEIDHTALMGRLRARIKDKRVCALVKAFLKSGVHDNHREHGRDTDRNTSGRDSVPAAGEYRSVGVGRAFHPTMA